MILRVIERRREMYRCREGSHYTGGTHWNPPDGQLREVRQRVFILAGFTFINKLVMRGILTDFTVQWTK